MRNYFKVGDHIVLPGQPPTIVQVTGYGLCPEGNMCRWGHQMLSFVDPRDGVEDWVHASEVRKAAIVR